MIETSNAWKDPRIPDSDQYILRYVLDRRSEEIPTKTFVRFEDGGEWSYREVWERTRRLASGLQSLGVKQGDFVIVWLPQGIETVLLFFAINYLGAVYVPINEGYKGGILQHVLGVVNATIMVAHSEFFPRLKDIQKPGLQTIISVTGDRPQMEGVTVIDFNAVANGSGTLMPLKQPIKGWDTQAIIFTSGTTGASKGVILSYLQTFSMNEPYSYITAEDRYLATLPMFHVGGIGIFLTMLNAGGSIALIKGFNTKTFWEMVRSTETTVAFMLGAMAQFVAKLPPAPNDADNPLRIMIVVPMIDDVEIFSRRFGISVYTIYHQTEISTPLASGPNPVKKGTCGRLRPGVEGRLVDENDCEVPTGEVGELIVRTDRPWAMNKGYANNFEATANAWRNGWFHTGDAFRRDADGDFFFVDRLKDAIRRRGENISSMEVEKEVIAHPDVQEAAVVAVPSEYSEDDVMAVVAPIPGHEIDPIRLIDFLRDRLPHFMIPRYIRLLPELPKTATAKVQKNLLRQAGITSDTWDREAAGIKIKKERLR